MGRSLELYMLNAVMRAARSAGAQHLRIAYKATAKNVPLRSFLQQYMQEVSAAWEGDQETLISTKIDHFPLTAISEAPVETKN
jgi:predicted enzyme involved in methoxymalonyl-ACP biosynthesis